MCLEGDGALAWADIFDVLDAAIALRTDRLTAGPGTPEHVGADFIANSALMFL